MANSDLESELCRLYLAGKTRQEAKATLNIRNNNAMSGISHRLGLHWSWSLENRRSGIAPVTLPELSSSSAAEKPKTARAPAKPKQATSTSAATSSSTSLVESETTPTRHRRMTPSPGIVSARDRRLRGYGDNDPDPMFPADMSAEDRKFFRRLYAG